MINTLQCACADGSLLAIRLSFVNHEYQYQLQLASAERAEREAQSKRQRGELDKYRPDRWQDQCQQPKALGFDSRKPLGS